MIEISSPDALGIIRISVDGTRRCSIVPLRLGEAAQARYGRTHEYAMYPAGRMSGQSFHLEQGEAMASAMDLIKYWT